MKVVGDLRYPKPSGATVIPEYQITRVLTATEVNLLDTNAVTLVQAPGSGLWYLPGFMYMRKEAGTAYTAAGSIVVGNPTNYGGFPAAGFLDQVTVQRRYRPFVSLAVDDPTAYINGALTVLSTGAISGGTGRVVVTVGYKIIQSDGFF